MNDMFVKCLGDSDPVRVYGVYWVGGERYFWIIPYVGYGGFLSVSEKEVSVVDDVVPSDFVVCKDGEGKDMLIHWAAEDLLHGLVEHDPVAMDEFLMRLGL